MASIKIIKMRFLLVILLYTLTGCNFREQCFSRLGYENTELCDSLLLIYTNSTEEEKSKFRVNALLTVCLLSYSEVNKCKKESTRWPLPD